MNKKTIISSLLAVLLGIMLAFVRTGKSGLTPFPLYYVFLFITVIILFALSFITPGKSNINENSSFSGADCGLQSSKAVKALAAVSFVFLLAAAVICFITGEKGVLTFVSTAFLFFCSLSFVVRAKYSDGTDKCKIYSLFPVYYSCINLLLFYRQNAKLPQISLYAPEAFCLIFLVLASYFSSASLFGKEKTKTRFLFTLSFLSLTVSELCTFIVNRALVLKVAPLYFIPMIAGFSLFYTTKLFSLKK